MPPQTALGRQIRVSGAAALTALGVRKFGFFVPYLFAQDVDSEVAEYPAMTKLFEARVADFSAQIEALATYLDAFRAFSNAPEDPDWNNKYFAPRDGVMAYAMVRRFQPRRILEIGSGSSTRFMLRAIRDAGIECQVTCIDPSPRSVLSGLDVNHISRMLRIEDVAEAEQLDAGDILFIDSSHIMLQGMDVDIEFNFLFPVLKPGVIVHIHDIFLPFGYPDIWGDRVYSEQNALPGWIISGYFDLVFGGQFATRRLGSAWNQVAAAFPPLRASGSGSLWLKRSGPTSITE